LQYEKVEAVVRTRSRRNVDREHGRRVEGAWSVNIIVPTPAAENCCPIAWPVTSTGLSTRLQRGSSRIIVGLVANTPQVEHRAKHSRVSAT